MKSTWMRGWGALLCACAVLGCSSDTTRNEDVLRRMAEGAPARSPGGGAPIAAAANGGSEARLAGSAPKGGGAGASASDAGPDTGSGDIPCEVAAVLRQHCARCHGRSLREGAPLALVDAAGFKRDLSGIDAGAAVLNRVADAVRPMPPAPASPLTAAEIGVLRAWIEGGAQPANPGCSVDPSSDGQGAAGASGSGVVLVTPEGGARAVPPDLDAGPEPEPTDAGSTEPPPPAATPASWPSFGFDLANSRNNLNERTLSARNVGRLRELWRFSGPSTTSTPAVLGGVVYLPGWDGRVYARRLDDGSEVWTSALPDLIDSSPTVTGARVYVSDDNGSVHALERSSGQLRWSQRVDDHAEAHLWSSPVYIASASLLVVGVASGEEQVLTTDYTFRGSVVGLDADSGRERWRFETASEASGSGPGIGVWGTAAIDETRKLAFIGTGNNYDDPAGTYSDSLLAIAYQTGELVWYKQFTPGDTYTIYGSQGPDYDIGSSANLFTVDGRDLVGIGVKNGNYYALDRESGSVIWMTPITPGTVLGGVIGASAYADGLIFVASNTFALANSTAVAIDARDGRIQWRHDLSNLSYGGVAHANGVVYLGSTGGSIYALDGASGQMLWGDQTPLSQPIGGGVTIADGRLLVPWGYQWTLREGNAGNGGMTVYGL